MRKKSSTSPQCFMGIAQLSDIALLILISLGIVGMYAFVESDMQRSIPGFIHWFLLLFMALVLAQRSRAIAYFLLPAILCGRFIMPCLYDLLVPLTYIPASADVVDIVRVHVYYMRTIYHVTPGLATMFILVASLMYIGVYIMRRYMKKVTLITPQLTWLIAGAYVMLSLILLPFGVGFTF